MISSLLLTSRGKPGVLQNIASLGDIRVVRFVWPNSLIAIAVTFTVALIIPSGADALEEPFAKEIMGSAVQSAHKSTMLGSCQADLAVESIELRKSGPTGPTSIRMVVRNVGLEAFSTSPIFAKAVIEIQDGANGVITRHAVGNIVLVQPGLSRQFAVTLRRAVFGTFPPLDNNAGQIRASISFSPNALRCGIDPNSANDELVATHEQVRSWLLGSQPNVFVGS